MLHFVQTERQLEKICYLGSVKREKKQKKKNETSSYQNSNEPRSPVIKSVTYLLLFVLLEKIYTLSKYLLSILPTRKEKKKITFPTRKKMILLYFFRVI